MSSYDDDMPVDGPEHGEPRAEPRAGRARQRAPRQKDGQRAQLTVPQDMWREVAQLAVQAGTTPNDVLVRLAGERLQQLSRRQELQVRAEQRWRAFREGSPRPGVPAEPLGESELIAFSRALRDEG